MRKIFSAILYLLTGGFFLVGVLYDFLTLNEQVNEINSQTPRQM